MKAAVLEKIIPDFGSSFKVMSMQNDGAHCLNYWHYHPEYELVYIDRGSASRHIGNSITRYEDGDLILVGSNLPHRSFTEDLLEPHKEVVIQWAPDFMGTDFFEKPELETIKYLLDRSKNGLYFYGATKKIVGEKVLKLEGLSQVNRLSGLLEILELLAQSKEYNDLKAGGLTPIFRRNDQERIEMIFEYVKQHYAENIELDIIARTVNMTKQSFCRYFKQCTALTFFEFVNQYRISKATQMLANTSKSVNHISHQCGFNNLSTFNKHFKKITNTSPLKYRYMYQRVL